MSVEEYIRRELSYDPETGDIIWIVSRPAVRVNTIAGCIKAGTGGKSYRYIGVHGTVLVAHKVAWLLKTGDWPQGEVDHKDGNSLNNKWDNLRDVGHAENCKNIKKAKNNTSGVTGVVKRSDTCWLVQIGVNGIRKYIGSFRTLQEATVARDKAYKEHGFHPNHGQTITTMKGTR
jgi:hypothetical protein